MAFRNNISYIFLPFSYMGAGNFEKVVNKVGSSPIWEPYQVEVKYLLKYVAEKFNMQNTDKCRCYHYTMKKECRADYGLGTKEDVFYIKGDDYEHSFRVLGVHMYCFSTGVGIISLKLSYEETDYLYISNAQYYLKKVSRTSVYKYGAEKDKGITLYDAAKNMLRIFDGVVKYDIFCYANDETERANMLTLVDLPKKDDYELELFYLRRGYSKNFLPLLNDDFEDITFRSVNDLVWGISSEASVCIMNTDGSQGEFLKSKFYENFNEQYLLMYVILLHQKYTLYTFLTETGTSDCDNLNKLEEYRHNLYRFEADFVFARVTEVPQYQKIYEKTYSAFSLEQMYEDVREPLKSLSEIRIAAEKKEQRERDKRLNNSILLLSLLSVFSAVADGVQIAELFGEYKQIPTIIFAAAPVAILIYILISLIFRRKDRNKNDRKKR